MRTGPGMKQEVLNRGPKKSGVVDIVSSTPSSSLGSNFKYSLPPFVFMLYRNIVSYISKNKSNMSLVVFMKEHGLPLFSVVNIDGSILRKIVFIEKSGSFLFDSSMEKISMKKLAVRTGIILVPVGSSSKDYYKKISSSVISEIDEL